APLACVPHVTDFVLARRLVEASASPALTGSHAIIGTASYMSPEQAGGHSRQLTTAADGHSLGAILHECLTGRPPFQGESLFDTLRRVRDETPELPSAVRSGIGRDLDTICRKCLEKDPHRRYESAPRSPTFSARVRWPGFNAWNEGPSSSRLP